jgi:hypothetical protein
MSAIKGRDFTAAAFKSVRVLQADRQEKSKKWRNGTRSLIMKRALVTAALTVLALTAQANDRSTERWFGVGETWYQHPCGVRAFDKYGQDDRPEVRRAYELTKHHPELCSKLFS